MIQFIAARCRLLRPTVVNQMLQVIAKMNEGFYQIYLERMHIIGQTTKMCVFEVFYVRVDIA